MNAWASRYTRAFALYPYTRHADQDRDAPVRHPVVIVGGGPIGMALALDLGQRGVGVVVLDDHDGVGQGSRAICFAKRTLEICDRLGPGQRMVDKGEQWNLGRVFRGEDEIYTFNLLPEDGHRRPAFINLQQPYFEKFLVDAIREAQEAGAPIDIRGCNRVVACDPKDDHVALEVDTPDGPYRVEADWLVACDGANSPIRDGMGLGFDGRVFEDNFLIADIRMQAPFPTERRFWFDPPFNPGQTALMHKQPDDVWRLDFQLGWDIDRQAELDEDRIRERVRGMIGDRAFDMVWTSIYTFRCCTMDRYVHGRVIFAGDSAHQVSPFGARGANGGMQDADNLGWKLAAVLQGPAPEALIESYHVERKHAGLENIRNSSRTADFLTPRSPAHALFRDAVLDLVEDHAFARPMVNSGRLSAPASYDGSPLNGADDLPGAPARSRPGSPCPDAPLGDGFLLDHLTEACLLGIGAPVPEAVTIDGVTLKGLTLPADGLIAERYLGSAARSIYLIRPDQHVAARWEAFDPGPVALAVGQMMGRAC
ncbi:FAD-dependent oxidoreductase [Pseudaestuariivita atlantica]|uniref:FAD-dependent oxidoreductase n=1 Tax=Pseudaestuariivita atlantica TaxID=1317121 RepID=A0A0L1JKQ4_9RHOB|nr:FAD-dependent oxidoreductase [Pseudaestuariivita atlantica]KNG92335.1 FAD-dependent oxidoreductase [Pseudaestuariivita atlantica]